MEDIYTFFRQLKEKKTINYKDEKKAIKNTISIFDKADTILDDAIADENKNLKDKIIDGQVDYRYFSEIYITEEFDGQNYKRPIVDLVQQGGGMHGIALLGYTYIMEKIGIRFYSHGGTSAGAINATFLAAIGSDIYTKKSIFNNSKKSRQTTKSEILTHIIVNTVFGDFMGRTGIIGWFQSRIFKNQKMVMYILGLLSLSFLLGVYWLFGCVFSETNGLSGRGLRFYDFIIGTLNVFALLVLAYILLVKMLGSRFGINSGKEFYTWSESLLESLEVKNTDGLYEKMKIDLHKTTNDKPHCDPRLVLITSNLTHNRLVKFPEEASDYWSNANDVKPAAYLRATMSLPFIFETFIPGEEDYCSKKEKDYVKIEARFVDGGMLSNFPIREFHRKDNKSPLFPTFGVLLSEIGNSKDVIKEEDTVSQKEQIKIKKTTKKKTKKLKNIKLLGNIATYFKTFRSFYDSDFIESNDEIKNRVVLIETAIDKKKPKGKHFNWLDFWMKSDTQKKLFIRGVEAAIEQIDKFEWKEYLITRNKSNTI